MFFDIFTSDMKKVTNILRIHRRMMGVDKPDDPEEIETEQQIYTKKSTYEKAVMIEIEYILVKIGERCHPSHHNKVVELITSAATLVELRSSLFKLTA